MTVAALLWVVLSAGGSGDPLPGGLRLDEPVLRVPPAQPGPRLRPGFEVGAEARVALPFGAADKGTIITTGPNTYVLLGHLNYAEIFDPGWGITLEGALMFRPPPPLEGEPLWTRSPSMGAYVAFEWDRYGGDVGHDGSGLQIEPDTLEIPSIFVGFKASGEVEGNFFGDLRFGMGGCHYPSLEATFRPPIGLPSRGELFADTWAFAMELRMHFGWHVGPVGIMFGMGGRLQAPADNGKQSDLDPGPWWTLDFDLALTLGF